jgi:hypothetical protein
MSVIYRQASFLAATKPRNEIEEQWREHELLMLRRSCIANLRRYSAFTK